MNDACHYCSMQLNREWVFCPRCGRHPERVTPYVRHDSEKVPVTGAFSGLYMGLILTPVLLIVGTMLCLTGLGAVLGIPMIIAGIVSPLAGPLFGLGAE